MRRLNEKSRLGKGGSLTMLTTALVAAAHIFLMVQQPHSTQPTIFLIGMRRIKIAQATNLLVDAGRIRDASCTYQVEANN
jgi:hypothetical protein